MITEATKNRNRRQLIRALALGLRITATGAGYAIQSEADSQVEHQVSRISGRWYCGCRWASQLAGGYDPRSNALPCKHVLLAIAVGVPAKLQDRLIQADPALRAAAASGAQIRTRRPARQADHITTPVAEVQRILAAARATSQAPALSSRIGAVEMPAAFRVLANELFG